MGKETYAGPLEQVNEYCWRIPRSYKQGMRVDGLIFTDERLLPQLRKDQAPEQVANVAFLPGIQTASIAMPDIHWGYGFCIGGVAATDPAEGGFISPVAVADVTVNLGSLYAHPFAGDNTVRVGNGGRARVDPGGAGNDWIVLGDGDHITFDAS